MGNHRNWHSGDSMSQEKKLALSLDTLSMDTASKYFSAITGLDLSPEGDPTAKLSVDLARALRGAGPATLLFAELPVEEITAESLRAIDGPVFTGAGFARYLEGANAVIVYLMTLGDITGSFSQADLLEQYLTDTWASIFCELAFSELYRGMSREYGGRGLFLSQEYSPGYEGFDLENQARIFELLKPESVGVRLSPGHMMSPEKTVTGFIGVVGKDIFRKEIPCRRCVLRNTCQVRDHTLCGLAR